MTRRRLAALSLLGLLLVAGCVDAGLLDGTAPSGTQHPPGNATEVPTPNAANPVVLDLPDAPDSITTDTVGPFVTASEEVRMHNEIVSETQGVVRLGVDCDVETNEATADGFTVTVQCGHWYEFDNSDGRGIADGAPYQVTYVVGEDGSVAYGERVWVTRT